MDKARESRRSSTLSTTGAFRKPRRPTISLRGSSQEGQVELQETVSLRAKRRRGSHSHSTDESVGNEQGYDVQDARVSRVLSPNNASSASDQNHHRRSFPPATPLRPASPPPWKITDEIIGVTVPKKARSASVKRAHGSWVSEEQSLQGAEMASPSSSNVCLLKKMQWIGPKTRLPKTSKSSSSTHEEIEIEIAELLYGLMTSKNHDSSQKLEASDSLPPRTTSPSSHPSADAEKKKVEDYSSSALVPNNSTAESIRIESEQPAKEDNGNNASRHDVGSSEVPKEGNEEDNSNSVAGCGVTVDGRSELFTGESSSCSKSKSDVDKQDFASTRLISAVLEANGQLVDKFEIDLMAPVMLSPESDNLSRDEDSIKVEDKVERLVKKEKTHEEIEQVKMNALKEKWDVLNLDLEKPNKHNDIVTDNKLEEHYRNKEQPTKSTYANLENTVQSSPVPLSTAVPARPSSLSTLGYMPMPPLQTIVKTDKTTESLTAPQHVNFVLSQPRPKGCATHHYIARNIFLHQQCTKMSALLPSAVGCGSLCGTKPNNANRMPSAESMVEGKQSQKHSPNVNQNAAQDEGWAATSNHSLAAIKSFGLANPMDTTQMKQLVLQEGPHPGSIGNLVHGTAFLLHPGQHQASATTATSQAGSVNSTSSASSSNKSHNSSAAGCLGTSSTLPAVGAAVSFSYSNLAANDAPDVTIVQNSGYPFPFSTPPGASAAIRGAGPAQSTPILSGPLYSPQIFHPLQRPQQHAHPRALVQSSYLNVSTSNGSSSSHKQSQGTQVNGNNILNSTAMQLQQSQKQHTSLSYPHTHETGMAGENDSSVATATTYPQKNVLGQNFMIPVQPLNLSFRPSATSDSVGGNIENFGDKRQHQQQAVKGEAERIPSQAFAISFPAFNGSNVPSNLNFSSIAQNPVIFQSLPYIAWQGYQAASTSHTTQQKIYSSTEGKSGGNSSLQDDEKKATSGKPSTNGPTTLVFDNSSKNLNFVSSPMNGNWPDHSISSTASTSSLPLSSNASNSQQPPQLLHLQQHHGMLQQQPVVATQYKASLTNATTATKFVNGPRVFSQTLTQCKSSNQASQSKNLGRNPDSRVHNASITTSTAPTLKNFSQEQARVLQGHTQISFGRNHISSLPPRGPQLLNNNQPFGITVVGTPPNGGKLKTNSQRSIVGLSKNPLQMQQTESSSAGTGQKSSPVCGRNVPSILSSCPSHLSELKYWK